MLNVETGWNVWHLFWQLTDREREWERERDRKEREREWNRIYLIKKYLDPELEQLFTETKKSRELLCKRERDKILDY